MPDNNNSIAGSTNRPIGNIKMFLEDIRARGFIPRGIIDVGANRGDWTRMALSVFPETKVVMIEPQQEMQQYLNQLCRENSDLEVIQAGAGREEGELVQTIWEDLAGSSFLPETSEEKLRDGTQRVTPIVTIDKVVKDRGYFFPDLVKLDIQGFELEALKGAASLFGRTQIFILETSLYEFMPKMPTTADCINYMSSRGYEFYDVTEYLRRPFDGALAQIDLAFALRDGVLRHSNKWFAE
jgi:FkbM family methyltransferase